MHHLQKVLSAHPDPRSTDADRIARAAATLAECAYCCRACADACLGESADKLDPLRPCIATDLACAEICQSVGNVLIQQTAPDPSLLKALVNACENACRICAEECGEHAEMHAHCKHCSEICRECGTQCRDLIDYLGGPSRRAAA